MAVWPLLSLSPSPGFGASQLLSGPECVLLRADSRSQPAPELPVEPCQPLAVADFENCSFRLTDESRLMYFYWKINISLMKTWCTIRVGFFFWSFKWKLGLFFLTQAFPHICHASPSPFFLKHKEILENLHRKQHKKYNQKRQNTFGWELCSPLLFSYSLFFFSFSLLLSLSLTLSLLSVLSSQVWASCAAFGKRLFQGFCAYSWRNRNDFVTNTVSLMSLHLALRSISAVQHKLKDKTLCQMKNFIDKRASLMLCCYSEFTCLQPSSENRASDMN